MESRSEIYQKCKKLSAYYNVGLSLIWPNGDTSAWSNELTRIKNIVKIKTPIIYNTYNVKYEYADKIESKIDQNNKISAIQVVFSNYIQQQITIYKHFAVVQAVNDSLYIKVGLCQYMKFMQPTSSTHELYYLPLNQMLLLWNKLLSYDWDCYGETFNEMYNKHIVNIHLKHIFWNKTVSDRLLKYDCIMRIIKRLEVRIDILLIRYGRFDITQYNKIITRRSAQICKNEYNPIYQVAIYGKIELPTELFGYKCEFEEIKYIKSNNKDIEKGIAHIYYNVFNQEDFNYLKSNMKGNNIWKSYNNEVCEKLNKLEIKKSPFMLMLLPMVN